MKVTFDESEAEMGGCPPADRYLLKVVEVKGKKSKDDHPFASLKLEIQNGPYHGWNLYDVVMFAGKGAGIGKAKSKAFGIDLSQGAEIDTDMFMDRMAFGHCVRERYDGKDRLKVDISEGDYCGYDVMDGEDFEDIPFG